MEEYDYENLNKQLPIKIDVEKMETIIDNLSKYLEMLKTEILHIVVSNEAYKIEQQFNIIFQCFNDLKKEMISVDNTYSMEETDTHSNASEETVALDIIPENMPDVESNESEIKMEVVLDNSSTLNLEVHSEIEQNIDDHVNHRFEQESAVPQNHSLRRSRRRSCKKITNSPEMLCVVCQDRLVSISDLCEHMKMHIEHECDHCSKVFSTSLELDEHMQMHTEGQLLCKSCGKCFNKMSNLKSHINRVHTDDKGRPVYKCNICFKGFTEESALNKHIEFHSDVTRPYKCEQCEKCFPSGYLLREHLRVHTGVRPFKCPELKCKKDFLRKQHLREHVLIHKKKLKCTYCRLFFPERNKLNKHISLRHETMIKPDNKRQILPGSPIEEDYEISRETMDLPKPEILESDSIDDKLSKSAIKDEEEKVMDVLNNEDAQDNVLLERKNRKIDLKCTYCFEEFRSYEELKSHATTHKGIAKKFKCEECEKCFAGSFHLEEHKRLHTGERPYKCDICTKTFYRRGNFREHMGTHSKLFNCELCDRTFGDNAKLRKHMKWKHYPPVKAEVVQIEDGINLLETEISETDDIDSELGDIGMKTDKNDVNDFDEQNFSLPKRKTRRKKENKKARNIDLKCSYCFEEFETYEELKKHAISHRGIAKKFKCEECEKCFGSRFQLEEHKRFHTGERPYHCEICSKTFFRRGNFRDHMGTHSKPCKCELCDKAFGDNSKLRKHMKWKHVPSIEAGPFLCDICSKVFTSSQTLKVHLRIHEKGFLCDECDKAFPTKYGLKEHKKRHTGERPFSCPECGKGFYQRAQLKDHMPIHYGKKIACEHCEQKFATKSLLSLHKKRHSDDKPFQCSQCGAAYRNNSSLQQHIMSKHTQDKPFHCSDCPMQFITTKALKEHLRVHTGDKPFICDHCGMSFYRLASLKRHVKMHTGEGLYQCEICEKTFPVTTELRNHMRTHTGEKLFQCDECGKAFVQSSHLKDHITTHSEQKQYKCLECGKDFKRYSSLRDHMKTHTGQDLSTCSDCGKTFINTNQLTRHMQKHHGKIREGSKKYQVQHQVQQYVPPQAQERSSENVMASHIAPSVSALLPAPVEQVVYLHYEY